LFIVVFKKELWEDVIVVEIQEDVVPNMVVASCIFFLFFFLWQIDAINFF
jgi:hypothetical protein